MAFKALSKSEKSYIQSSLQAKSPLRTDGRSLHQFRGITLQTGVVPIANGSAHLNLGRSSDESLGGTEVLAAAKLEVEDVAVSNNGSGPGGSGVEGGRIVCSVSWYVEPIPHTKKEKKRKAEKGSCIRKVLPPRIRTSPRRRWKTCNTTTARRCTTCSRTPRCVPRTSASSQAARVGSSRLTSRSSPTQGISTTRSSWQPEQRCGTLACRGPELSSIAPTAATRKRGTWTSIPNCKARSIRESRVRPRRISNWRIIGTMGSCWAVETSGP